MRLLTILFFATTTLAAPPQCEQLSLQLARVERGVRAEVGGLAADHYLLVATADQMPPIVREGPSLDRLNEYFELPMVTKAAPFRVTAVTTYGTGAEAVTCRTEATVVNEPNARLSSVAGRVVVPAAGSTSGAFGGRFKTSLRLTGFGTGRIYFRPQGTFFGDERDPSIPYDLGFRPVDGPLQSIYFDDIVAAIGATGLGNLDVLPDVTELEVGPPGRYAPHVEARVYSDSPVGRFGSPVPALGPGDFLTPGLTIPVNPETLDTTRINVGIRTFGEPVTVSVNSLSWLGGVLALRKIELPANTFRQFPLAELMGRAFDPALDGEIGLYFSGRPVTAYYSVTENSTNDPDVRTLGPDWHIEDVGLPVISVRQ